jgi:hypothetical protein
VILRRDRKQKKTQRGGANAEPTLVVMGARQATALDRAWDDRARTLQLDALTSVRASAERWAATLAVLLAGAGLAALLKGPGAFEKLTPFARDGGKLAFFGGVVAGLAAVGLAGMAAQGVARRVFLPGGSSWRKQSDAAIKTAVCRLRWSRVCAFVALTAVSAAAGALWWGQVEDKLYLKVRLSGEIVCGEPERAGSVLRLIKPDGKKTAPIADVTLLGTASSC